MYVLTCWAAYRSAYADQLARFGLSPEVVFVERDADYYNFKPEIRNKVDIHPLIENHPNVKDRQAELEARLVSWWNDAAKAIENFPGQNHLAEFRRHFQNTLLQALLPVGVLDEFQIAGIFANWWEAERYDFKTIVAAGWSPSLIPDEYILNAFFRHEQAEIESLETRVAELQAELDEVLVAVNLYNENEDNEEGESTPSAVEVKQALKNQIAEIKAAYGNHATTDLITDMSNSLKKIETQDAFLKKAKRDINKKHDFLISLIQNKCKQLTDIECRQLILSRFNKQINTELEQYIKQSRYSLLQTFNILFEK